MSPHRVVHVIDDDEAVLSSLALLLGASGLDVRTYPSAPAFLDGLQTREPGCVLTDVQMPAMTGLQLLHRLSLWSANFAVILFTGRADVAMAVEALKSGALDFIEKPFDDELLLAAVRSALARAAQSQMQGSRRAEAVLRLGGLTKREREVLAGLAAGSSNKQVGRELGISPRTVEAYRAHIMRKSGAASFSELIRLSLLAGPG